MSTEESRTPSSPPEYISYEELLSRINMYSQGILPNNTLQVDHNERVTPRERRNEMVIPPPPVYAHLLQRSQWANPPDMRYPDLRRPTDVEVLTPTRLYEIVFFAGTAFEEHRLYRKMGELNTQTEIGDISLH